MDESAYIAELPTANLKNLDEIISRLHSLSNSDKEKFANVIIKEV